jgi:hypothetical protein
MRREDQRRSNMFQAMDAIRQGVSSDDVVSLPRPAFAEVLPSSRTATDRRPPPQDTPAAAIALGPETMS